MDSLFGVSLTSILSGLMLVTSLIIALLIYIGWRHRLLLSMGFRNVIRRKTQTALIVIGLMLSTLIISAAFATGDTVAYSVTNGTYWGFGNVDVIGEVKRDSPEGIQQKHVEQVRQHFASNENVDGVTGTVKAYVPAINLDQLLSSPQAVLVGIDDLSFEAFGPLTSVSECEELNTNALENINCQLDIKNLEKNEVYVTYLLAEEIQISKNETIRIYIENSPYDFKVKDIIHDNNIVSHFSNDGGWGGVVTNIESSRSILKSPLRVDNILISAQGGIRGTLDLIPGIENDFKELIKKNDLPIRTTQNKSEAIDFAELIGSIFVTFFLIFGLFSIAAGIMLIFLTFVLLAAERKAEMGMARAIGMNRLQLTFAFIAEGMTYNIVSAFIGAALGLGVSYALLQILESLVFDDFGLELSFHFNWTGFFVAYLLGIVITFITVALASWRSANINIVRAIRDIPEPDLLKSKDTSFSGLIAATGASIWYLIWFVLVSLGAVLVFFGFIYGLTTYGASLLAGIVISAFYIWGATHINHKKSKFLIFWWISFNIIAFITWLLLRTKQWASNHQNTGGWALLMLLIGCIAVYWGGWISQQAFAYTAGMTLAIFSIAMMAVHFKAQARLTFTIASIITLWYWLLPLPFSLFIESATTSGTAEVWQDPVNALFKLFGLGHADISGNIEMFFVSGICITAASTLFVIFNADILVRVAGFFQPILGGITPAVRTAISYPLASKFRTGMTLSMFTLVVFSLVVMATLNYNFTQLFTGEDAQGGFDIQIIANENNALPDLRTELINQGYDLDTEIRSIGKLQSHQFKMRPTEKINDKFKRYQVSGIDSDFIDSANFPLSTFAKGYSSEQSVMSALKNNSNFALGNPQIFVRDDGGFGPPPEGLQIEGSITDLQETPWEPIAVTFKAPDENEERIFYIIGFVESPIISGTVPQWNSLFINYETFSEMHKDNDPESYFLVTNQRDVENTVRIANGIERSLINKGVQAISLSQKIQESASTSNAFSSLFQGFMSLGLIVGVAALGVIAFRTVTERRQQIGMLRAIGYSRKLIAFSFFLESSFIALTGIVLGVSLGAALGYNLMTSPDFTDGTDIDVVIPWTRVLIVVGIAYLASAIMTILPARSASKVPVAEALRYE